ncbi:hypothetical protein PoB_006942500 [Plakobranchus ocellatus]|uniref:Uncharacterized protein n=1 Tax=Plakobranchus ocellatus TaxID=259542 RepID=A0AAV4DG00_9GAST|nr:hypothetical protein PoB_006942500 [Plakobranchus ocellatus]
MITASKTPTYHNAKPINPGRKLRDRLSRAAAQTLGASFDSGSGPTMTHPAALNNATDHNKLHINDIL